MQITPGCKLFSFMLVMALLLATAGTVAAQQVTYNFMPGTDFSKCHTYKWVQIPSNVHPNQIVNQEIIEAINNVLASKGFSMATGDTADLYVGYRCVEQANARAVHLDGTGHHQYQG